MADDLQFTPLPSDAQYDPSPPPAPGTTQPPQATPQLPQFTPLPANTQYDQPPQPYRGSILPFSTDAQGNTRFDPHAGLLGSALDFLTAPGDVLTGRQPTPYTGGDATADPALLARAANFATFASPMSAASRTGAAVPGMWSKPLAPTEQQLKTAADAGFDAARASPQIVPGPTLPPYVQGITQELQQTRGLVPKTAPKTYDALNDLAMGGDANFTTLDATRRELNAVRTNPQFGDSDKLAASIALGHVNNLISTTYPEARTALNNIAAAERSSDITGALSTANTGIPQKAEGTPDVGAALRRGVKSFMQNEKNTRGFSDEEKSALTDFGNDPGFLASALTKLSKFGGWMGGAAGAYLGAKYMPGEHGAELGGLAGYNIGGQFKQWGSQLASNQLDAITANIRSNSPLGREYQGLGLRMPSGLSSTPTTTGFRNPSTGVTTATPGTGVSLRNQAIPPLIYNAAPGVVPGYDPSYRPPPQLPLGLLDPRRA